MSRHEARRSAKVREKTKRGSNLVKYVLARRGSGPTVMAVSEQETTQGEKQKQNPISRQRGRNGRVRDFVDRDSDATGFLPG